VVAKPQGNLTTRYALLYTFFQQMRRLCSVACLLTLIFLQAGCFRKWQMSEREVARHYEGKAVKPVFQTIENDTLKLYVATVGADTLPPLLLIHGAPGTWSGYLNVLDDSLLQLRFQIIAIDRLGYHFSKHKKRKYETSIERQARAAALALSLNRSVHKGVVVGRSYGAPIAAKLALLFPNRFQKLVMLAGAVDPTKEKFWWFSKPGKWWITRQFLPRFLNTATYEKFAHAGELAKLDKEWHLLQMPVVAVQGGKDWIVDPTNLDYLRNKLANKPAQFHFLPEAGHLISISHPELVRKLVLE
jgi:pimeloyl-ACP methyl ester carboxylesterase